MTVLGLDHVSVTCADLDASLTFYHEALGIPVCGRGELRGGSAAAIVGVPDLCARFADLALPDGRTLELIEAAAGGPQHPDVLRPGATHLAFRVEDARAVFTRLRAAGWSTASPAPVTIDEPGGSWHASRAFYTRDPDGVTVEILQRP